MLQDWLPEGHPAAFISEVVDEALDLTAILATYETGDGRGQPPYHPALLVKLLLYGYCTGKPSSREVSVRRVSWFPRRDRIRSALGEDRCPPIPGKDHPQTVPLSDYPASGSMGSRPS